MNMNDKYGGYPRLESTYAMLPEFLYSRHMPSKVPNPGIVLLNKELIQELGVSYEFFNSEEGKQVLAGNHIIPGSTPIAQAYAGHQFEYFTMLGDGRACLLGEYIAKDGKRYDIQLKGSGRTPYSRGGDGKAALGPMIREYIISEAMHELHIPTTRSLAVTTTGEDILRDTIKAGAILTRIAQSHIRVGTFQYAVAWGEKQDITTLANYTIMRLYPHCLMMEKPYQAFLEEVVKKQAELIAKWQLVGFIHGVMNTDNMSISGETIDYGPCAFMDTYDPETVYSSIDTEGRYAYGNQPAIAAWNLTRFAETLLFLLSQNQEEAVHIAEQSIQKFQSLYQENWYCGMGRKLGLNSVEKEDKALIDTLLHMMLLHEADFTNTFLELTLDRKTMRMFYSEEFIVWNRLWEARLRKQNVSVQETKRLMQQNNPILIPRNQRVEEAIASAEKGDLSVVNSLLDALAHSYDYEAMESYQYYCELPEQNKCYKTFCGT